MNNCKGQCKSTLTCSCGNVCENSCKNCSMNCNINHKENCIENYNENCYKNCLKNPCNDGCFNNVCYCNDKSSCNCPTNCDYVFDVDGDWEIVKQKSDELFLQAQLIISKVQKLDCKIAELDEIEAELRAKADKVSCESSMMKRQADQLECEYKNILNLAKHYASKSVESCVNQGFSNRCK